MLTRDEVIDLLSCVQAYEEWREITAATVAAWQEAAARGRWTLGEAVEAVHAHYTHSTARIMPAHVTEAIRAKRQQPPPLDEQRKALPPVPPASADNIAAVRAEVARELGWTDEIERRAVMARRCRWCGAAAGEQCSRPTRGGRRVPTRPHPSRRADAEEAQMEQEAG